tara:strand:- start:1008 stop:1127 length:120 start_codon:yes stop_codon:yes gene_type:complete
MTSDFFVKQQRSRMTQIVRIGREEDRGRRRGPGDCSGAQ